MQNLWGDRRGNYALMTVVAMMPLMGGLAIAVDFAEMNRQKQAVANALDAAGLATAREIVGGASDADLIAYATAFFQVNLDGVNPADTRLAVTLPTNQAGGGTLKLSARLDYKPMFFPVFADLAGKSVETGQTDISFTTGSEIRLKNTLEVALVLDNSGSMENYSNSGQKRTTLLKAAARQLVDTLAGQARLLKQVDKPVQFSLVPFAASVNVGPQNAGASWMDVEGLSPVHHENFDWSTLNDADKRAERIGGVWYKKGTGWGEEEDGLLTRFSLYQDMKHVSSREWVATGQEYVCTRTSRRTGNCIEGHWQETGYYDETIAAFASWQGCVEARPYPYNVTDEPARGGANNTGIGFGDPATMFVPMFAPDEPGDRWEEEGDPQKDNFNAANNWWNDGTNDPSGRVRQTNMEKYFKVRPYGATSQQGRGPNYSCTTGPLTPLTDVSTEDGLATVKASIDAMVADGNTDVPEGLAWGWRTLSHGEPFTGGRPDDEKGNDKVVIVLTDGANTYSTAWPDPAGNKSTYAAYGYLQPGYDGGGVGRLLLNTSAGQYDYSSGNYTKALDDHMARLCDNAKAANVLVMTVSLDLSTSDYDENKAIEALKKCASDSRFRTNPETGKPEKLFWNATGSNLAEKFKEIADELSNLRIVG